MDNVFFFKTGKAITVYAILEAVLIQKPIFCLMRRKLIKIFCRQALNFVLLHFNLVICLTFLVETSDGKRIKLQIWNIAGQER